MSSKRSGSFLKRLERRFAPWAIPNLTGIIIAGQVLLYLARMFATADDPAADPLIKIYLLPSLVMQGEVWRLFSFPFIPPATNFLFAAIGWMIFFHFGTALETTWGTVRYNIFLFIGLLANIAAAFIAYSQGIDALVGNAFLYSTVFLAFARLFPNYVMHIYFILPIQIKWLALLMWLGYGYVFIEGDWMGRMLILASVLNYLVFFGREHVREVKRGARRRSYQAKAETATKKVRHECRVCGLNSNDAPKTLFRYCSKCSGQCCYCPDHIQDHEHITEDSEATV